MHHHHFSRFAKIAAVALAGWICGPIQTAVAQDDYETLTRGPIHEAFATTVSYDPEPGIIIDTAPPEAIEELAPEQQLEGENVAWIPGYWAWDEDQGNFLWVSGVWRNLPPSRAWVPGYWNPVGNRFQWISGYWAETQSTQVSYFPEPPRSLEQGPSIAAANNDQVWLPGSWIYQENRYAWRAGYWSDPRENWVYIPAHYIWTPRGHIFVNGYWDYAIPHRGIVFAPVYFSRPIYSRPGYRYSPSTVISISVFIDHLFLRPSYRHYYFGDYYAPTYVSRGFHASHAYHHNRRGYDPIYAYNRWSHRNDRNWETNHRREYEHRRDTVGARPPRSFAAQQQRPEYRDRNRALATPLNQFVANREASGQRLRPIDASTRERITVQNRAIRNFGTERQRSEGRSQATTTRPTCEVRENRGPSPLANRETTRPGPAQGTPVRPGTARPGSPATPQPERTIRPERPTQRGPETPSRAVPARPETPARGPQTPRVEPRPSRPQMPQRTEGQERVAPTPSRQATPREQSPPRTQPTPRVAPPQRVQPQQPQQRPQPAPRVESPQRVQPTPRAQPTQRPQPAPRVQPQQRPQPAPRVQPQPQPRTQQPQRPQQQPRTQPTPRGPAPQERSQPQRERQPQPERGGGSRGERRGR